MFEQVSNQELVSKIKGLVRQERELVTEVLRYLLEIESRGLHLKEGFSSMFAFCTEELGYTEPEAHIRIQAMRLMRAVPSVERHIEEGRLSLSVAARAQAAFRREQQNAEPVEENRKIEILNELLDSSVRKAEEKLAAYFPEPVPREKLRVVSEDVTEITFAARREFMNKLGRIKNLLAHKNFDGKLETLFELMAEITLKEIDPELQDDTDVLSAREVTSHSRYIRKADRIRVWKRAGSQCEYQSSGGRRCSERHGLQIDHVQEFSRGGTSRLENLRLLCGAHNRWRSRYCG